MIPGESVANHRADGSAILEIVRAGLATTVQDQGRPGLGRFGVSPSGAMDPLAHGLANRLVGNEASAATLEVTGPGCELVFLRATPFAIAGGDLDAALDGEPLAAQTFAFAPAGARLHFRQRRRGARACLAVPGGFDVPRVLSSASTDLGAGIGGIGGRPLRNGQRMSAPHVSGPLPLPHLHAATPVQPRPHATGGPPPLHAATPIHPPAGDPPSPGQAPGQPPAGDPARPPAGDPPVPPAEDPRRPPAGDPPGPPPADPPHPPAGDPPPEPPAPGEPPRPPAGDPAPAPQPPAGDPPHPPAGDPAPPPAGDPPALSRSALRELIAPIEAIYEEHAFVLRFVPEEDPGVPADAAAKFTTTTFRVSSRSGRTGFRFEGEALPARPDPERLSEPTAPGAIQLPPDGFPILLMADRNTIGGYPRLGHLATADRPRAAQLWPGDEVHFQPITLAEAIQIARETESAFQSVVGALQT